RHRQRESNLEPDYPRRVLIGTASRSPEGRHRYAAFSVAGLFTPLLCEFPCILIRESTYLFAPLVPLWSGGPNTLERVQRYVRSPGYCNEAPSPKISKAPALATLWLDQLRLKANRAPHIRAHHSGLFGLCHVHGPPKPHRGGKLS